MMIYLKPYFLIKTEMMLSTLMTEQKTVVLEFGNYLIRNNFFFDWSQGVLLFSKKFTENEGYMTIKSSY